MLVGTYVILSGTSLQGPVAQEVQAKCNLLIDVVHVRVHFATIHAKETKPALITVGPTIFQPRIDQTRKVSRRRSSGHEMMTYHTALPGITEYVHVILPAQRLKQCGTVNCLKYAMLTYCIASCIACCSNVTHLPLEAQPFRTFMLSPM